MNALLDLVAEAIATPIDGILKSPISRPFSTSSQPVLLMGIQVCFKTTIGALNGSVTEDFPPNRPVENDPIFAIHKEQVATALKTRLELQLKLIDTVGNTVKGLFNPMSFANVDLLQIIQAILAKK